MTMYATVISTNPGSLLVRDFETGMEVLVFFRQANRFRSGDRIRITFSGAMTRSIPPQITATSIQRVSSFPRPEPGPRPPETPEIRAIILQRSRNTLLVRDLRDNRQLRVNTPFAHHFCVGQRITVRYDTITMSNPPQVNAIDISPIC